MVDAKSPTVTFKFDRQATGKLHSNVSTMGNGEVFRLIGHFFQLSYGGHAVIIVLMGFVFYFLGFFDSFKMNKCENVVFINFEIFVVNFKPIYLGSCGSVCLGTYCIFDFSRNFYLKCDLKKGCPVFWLSWTRFASELDHVFGRIKRVVKLRVIFSIMPAVSLFVFLDTNCPGWRNRPVDLVNLRLRQLGRRTVIFSHRGGSISGGVVQLLDCNPHDALFFYENAWISVATYFYVRYGYIISLVYRIPFNKDHSDMENRSLRSTGSRS
ncbi:hypothetical protein B9Z55_028883 [Caenorhabditis nigoni]|nr:hypothetical protein B9Z55_028883 [Caenorhabditis nigoni]